MKRLLHISIMAAMIAVAYFAGSWNSRQGGAESHGQVADALLYYHCPMHPSYKSDKPGDAPCCGMKLIPVYENEKSAASDSRQELPSGAVEVSADKQRLIGVRTAAAQMVSGSKTFRLLGTVSADETRLYKMKAPVDGVISEESPVTVGSHVNKDQTLASYYSPEIYQAGQVYLVAVGTGRYRNDLQLQVAESRLRFLGMRAQHIEDLKKTQQIPDKITLCSPVSGIILSRNVYPNLVFQKGDELYQVADLSRMWVFADVFENEARNLRPGFRVRILHPQTQMRFNAQVSDVLPQFDGTTRTLKVRMEVANPEFALRPGMFVDVEFSARVPDAFTIPSDAVVDSGRRKTVYVEREAGVFEPRLIETGWRLGDRVQVTKGLKQGERIVTAGNFLIDSESRMKLPDSAGASMPENKTVKDPVCGMEIDPNSPNTLKVERDGQTYYFCMAACKNEFLANPAKYISKKPAAEPKRVKDLVCGMNVDPQSPHTLKTQYKGETYYFCSEVCKKRFEANPDKYVPKRSTKQPMVVKDLVCGMDVDPKSPHTLKTQYKGETYYFCSEMCKNSFETNPVKYIVKGTAKQAKMVKDLVCGMTVDSESAGVLKTEHRGETYYFCSEMCKKSFEANPAKYLNKGMEAHPMHGKEMPE
jgi:membrane fusion protein, copper/silver efflux system